SKLPPASLLVLLVGFIAGSVSARADVLEDLLKSEPPTLQQSRPATLELWERLVATVEGSDLEATRKISQEFNTVNDYIEPFQKEFATIVLQAFDLRDGTWLPE